MRSGGSFEPVLTHEHGLLMGSRSGSVAVEHVRVEVDPARKRDRAGDLIHLNSAKHCVVGERREQSLPACSKVELPHETVGEYDPKHPGPHDTDITNSNGTHCSDATAAARWS